MRSVSRPRTALLAVLLAAPTACSLLVSTGGLTSGGDDAGPTGSADATPATLRDTSVAPSGSDASDASVADTASGPEASLPETSLPETSFPDASADTTPCTPLASGLIGHYTMDVASISGTTLLDSSGNHNDGTLTGFSQPQPASAPAPFEQALVFPPTAHAYVNLPSLPLNTVSGGANSIAMWFYRSGSKVNDVLALLPDSPRYDLWLNSGPGDAGVDNYLCINTGNNDCFGIADSTLLGRWVHVVAVFANGPTVQGALYLDGVLRASTCLTSDGFAGCTESAVAATPVDLGGATDFFYHGAMSDVRVYDRALTAGEVKVLFGGKACP